MPKRSSSMRGFTLVEVMIVVAIIAILAAIAYPSYQEQMRKTRRADCEGTMMSAANALERYYTTNGTYAGATAGSNGIPASCPQDGSSTTTYTLSVSVSSSGHAYTITATPTGPQTGDSCGNLTLSNTGTKGASGGTVANCW